MTCHAPCGHCLVTCHAPGGHCLAPLPLHVHPSRSPLVCPRHRLSFVLPDGATDGSPQWEAFRHVFDAVAEGCEPRVPAEQSRRNLWLLKPGNGSCARGICVGDSVEVLQQHYQRSTQGSGQSLQTADDAAQAAAISRPREHWVVQKYVEAPMLYRGRKFDLRLFAVIESDRESALGFSVYVHREGYGRTSSETYSIAPNALHNSMHLTNYSIQKGARSYGRHERGNCVSFADLEASLGKASGFRDTLVPAMHALVADAVLAARSELLDTLRTACTPHAKYRSLIAFDMIVDAEGRPSILEINPSAGMEPQSEWHGKFFRRLLDDYVSLSVDVQIGRRQPFDSGRPLLDGTHVRQYPDDGWLLLLGAPGARPTPAEFDVRECAGRLVLARPGGMGGAPEADADEQLEQPTGHKPLSPDDGC